MKVGKYTLYSIETSQFGLDGGAMFGIIPKILWEKEAPADDHNCIQMVTRSLLLVSDERKIIIDTGLLGIGARAFFIIFGMGSAVGTAFGKKDLKDNFGFKKY